MSFRHSEAFRLKLMRVEWTGCPHCGAMGNWLVDDEEAPYCFHCGKEVYPDGAVAPDNGCAKTFNDNGCKAAKNVCIAHTRCAWKKEHWHERRTKRLRRTCTLQGGELCQGEVPEGRGGCQP